jgi:hypothetical protein
MTSEHYVRWALCVIPIFLMHLNRDQDWKLDRGYLLAFGAILVLIFTGLHKDWNKKSIISLIFFSLAVLFRFLSPT